MPTNVKVCINGFVLSTMLFDCTNSSNNQEGFLYGSVTRNVRREISDQSMSNTQEDILISVCSSVPCGSFLSFYNNVGEIKRDDLEYNLGERAENIVGWYRFRRYSPMFPSLREQSTHRHLRDYFASNKSNVDTSYFVFGILSSSNLPSNATHSYDYGFFIQKRDGCFRDLPLTILNLGDTRNSYRSGSLALPFMNSSSFNSVLSSFWNFSPFFETEDQIHMFHQRLRTKLESLQEELAASDAVNASLEDDIKRISNEMQALLATQERMACDAAAARELADVNTISGEIKINEVNATSGELELVEAIAVVSTKDLELEAEKNEMSESNSKKKKDQNESGTMKNSQKEVALSAKNIAKVDENVNERVTNTNEIRIASSTEKEYKKSQAQDSSVSKAGFDIYRSSEHVSDDDDDSQDSKSGSKDAVSPSLKRASCSLFDDDRTIKRACPDKYFEGADNETNTSYKVTSSGHPLGTVLVDQIGGISSEENGGDSSAAISENPVTSPASAVEIVVSDAGGVGLQSFGRMIVAEESDSTSNESFYSSTHSSNVQDPKTRLPLRPRISAVESSDISSLRRKVCDNVESDNTSEESIYTARLKKSKVRVPKSVVTTIPPAEVTFTKSLSDYGIPCPKEVTSSRCTSAPAKFLSEAAGSVTEDKAAVDENCAKVSSVKKFSFKKKPPFIIYAKELQDQPKEPVPNISTDSQHQIDAPKPLEPSGDKNNQAHSLSDQKEQHKKDVPEHSEIKEN